MRGSAIGLVVALLLTPAAAFAQAGPPGGPPPGEPSGPPPSGEPGGPPPGGPPPAGAISRDQFVQQRATAAGRLFDRIDVNHTGFITRAQLRAYMAQHRRGAGGAPPE
jgi:hypothetical protein